MNEFAVMRESRDRMEKRKESIRETVSDMLSDKIAKYAVSDGRKLYPNDPEKAARHAVDAMRRIYSDTTDAEWSEIEEELYDMVFNLKEDVTYPGHGTAITPTLA